MIGIRGRSRERIREGLAAGQYPMVAAVVVWISLGAQLSHADEPWLLVADTPAALPLTTPQRSLFDAGAMPSVAVYRPASSWLVFGLRLRGGLLGDGAAPAATNRRDPALGGLGSLTLGARLRLPTSGARRGDGAWLEIAGGGALTGVDLRPAIEAGVGYGFALGPINVGPSLRYVHIERPDDGALASSAGIALVGVELSLFDARDRAADRLPVMVASDPGEAGRVVGAIAADHDRIRDVVDSCPFEIEFSRLAGDGGCPEHGLFVLDQERIILAEHVLFDYRRARVKRRARSILRAIAAMWKKHPEWDKLVIVGHADPRGEAAYNQRLSEIRAARVRQELIELGVSPGRIETRGHGEDRPRTLGRSEDALQRNRRVEFVIVKSDAVEVPAP